MANDDVSGPIPRAPDSAEGRGGFTIEIKHLMAVAAILGAGATGGGVMSFAGSRNDVDTEKLATKESVVALGQKIDAISLQINAQTTAAAAATASGEAFRTDTRDKLNDLEQRVRALEGRRLR